MSGLDAYRGQLVAAGERLRAEEAAPAARGPRRWTRRRAAAAILAAVLISAPALAETQPWQPLLGDPHANDAPKRTSAPPPKAQLDALGVLRREQSQADRGAAARYALRFFSRSAEEIRMPFVRLLGSEAAGTAAVLLPAKRWDPAGRDGPASPLAKSDPLCLFVPDSSGGGGATACYTLAEIRGGEARGSLGAHYFGLVPDGVARIQVTYADGKVVTEPIVGNYYSLRQRAESRDIVWLDRNGRSLGKWGATAPSVAGPRRYRYRGRSIPSDEAAKLGLACSDDTAVCADSPKELDRLLGVKHARPHR